MTKAGGTRTPPCPVCDVLERADKIDGQKIDDANDRVLRALALGVALGNSHTDLHAVTRLVCAHHRVAWLRAMVNAAVLCNTEDRHHG